MCKYCKLKTLNKSVGEKTNESKQILKLMDGSQSFNLYLNRYVVEADGIHRAELSLELCANTEAGQIFVKDKSVNIKYCPFCGEEL